MTRRAATRAPSPPAAPRLDGELAELALDALPSGTRIEGVRIARASLAEVRAAGVTIAGSRLVDLDLGGARLGGLRLTDVAIERGSLANVVAPELALSRVEIASARLTGAQWTRGHVADTVFRDCRIDLATFAGTTFERTAFEDCRLEQAELRDALLRSVSFDSCDLTEADLTGLRIDRCELRGCALDGLAGAERLRGAAMPWADVVGHARLLAGALGIRVLDADEPG